MDHEGFPCFKSGVFNLEPCKVTSDTPRGVPLALSWPHFYQADPSYLDAVVGMSPNKAKHEFYLDASPELGIPLAIQVRLQINAIIRRDPDIALMRYKYLWKTLSRLINPLQRLFGRADSSNDLGSRRVQRAKRRYVNAC